MIEFILGVVFIVLCLPVLQSLSDIINGFSQVILSKMSVEVNKNNQKIESESGEVATSAIGFAYPDKEEYECEDDE